MFGKAIEEGVQEGVKTALKESMSGIIQDVINHTLREIVSNRISFALIDGKKYKFSAEEIV